MNRMTGTLTTRLYRLMWVWLIFLIGIPVSWAGAPPPNEAQLLRVSLLDVGQGDAILIQTPAEKTVLVDAGPGKRSTLLLEQLRQLGVTRIDAAFNTHPHEDHLGGFVSVLDHYTVRMFVDTGVPHTTRSYENMLLALKTKQVPTRVARRGQTYKLGDGARLEVLAPTDTWIQEAGSHLNNTSIVLRLTYGQFSMMLMGDAEAEVEAHLVAEGLEPAPVLKVGHHGSHSSSTPPFLDALGVRIALISCGEGNRYGHPHRETLNKFEQRGILVFRTDIDGQVRVLSDGKQVWVETFPRGRRRATPEGSRPLPARTVGPWAVSDLEAGRVVLSTDAAPTRGAPSADKSLSSAANGPPPAGGYVASAKSRVFHKAGCRYAHRISPANLRHYDTREEALADGKEPAHCCNP